MRFGDDVNEPLAVGSKPTAALLRDLRPRGIELMMRLLSLERALELEHSWSKNEFLHLLLTPIRANTDNEGQSRDRMTALIGRVSKW